MFVSPLLRRVLLSSGLGLAGMAVPVWGQGTLQVTNGLVAQFDAAKGVVNTNGKLPDATTRVARWADQASLQGSNVATVPTFGLGPYYLPSVPELNGRPALDFRNDATLGSSIVVSEVNVTWFVVFRSDFSATDRVMQFSSQTGTFVTPNSGGQVVARGWRNTGGSFPIDAAISNLAGRKQEFFIETAWRADADVIAQRLTDRNKQVLTANNTLANAAQNSALLIGGESTSAGLLNGQIAELLVYNRVLTAAERTSVEDYLHYKFFGPADSDGDSLPDEWETAKFGGLGQSSDGDPDGDLLTNRREFESNSNPAAADTDGDGLDDAREVAAGTAVLNADSDGDGASDPMELLAGTNPTAAASKPGATFNGLVLHSDMESGSLGDFSLRNLAGPGAGICSSGAAGSPQFRAEGISGEGVRLPGGPGLDFGTQAAAKNGSFTVSLAFRPEAGSGIRYLASQGNRDQTRPGWSLFLDGQDLVLRVMNSARTQSTSFRRSGPLAAGNWYQVAFSYASNGSIVPYLNGSPAGWTGGASVAGGLDGGPGVTLLLGMSDARTSPFTGSLDEFSLWSRVLTATEIGEVHTQGSAGIGLDGKSRNAAPAFTTEPKPTMVFAGQSFELTAQAAGATLQWQKNGGNLSGQTTGALLVNPAAAADRGRYRAVATFPSATRPSPEALVRVTDFQASQVFKTNGGVSAFDFAITALKVEGDGMAAGVPSYRPLNGNQIGRVYFLRRNPANANQWSVAQTIENPSSSQLYFGQAVALQGNTLVIGAYGLGQGAGNRYGRVYVYRRASAAANWALQQEILSPVQGDNDNFGVELVLDGSTLVIAAPGEMKAFVYGLDGNTWTLRKTLAPPGTPSRTLVYGSRMALQGDMLVIGDLRSGLTGDNFQGAVYLHHRNSGGSGQWGMTQKIMSRTPSMLDEFGRGVALDGETLAIGALKTKSVDIYSVDLPTGQATFRVALAKPVAPGITEEQEFTSSWARDLCLRGEYLVTGNGQDSEFGGGAGASFVFRRDPGSLTRWTLVKKIVGDDVVAANNFGALAVMQGNEIYATAPNTGSLYGFRVTRDTVPEVLVAPRTLADTEKEYLHDINVRVASGAVPVISAVTALPGWLTLQSTGTGQARLSGTPPAGAAGGYPIRLQVQEPYSLPATQEFTLHVLPGNLAPLVLQAQAEITAAEDAAAVTLPLQGFFLDGEDDFSALNLQVIGGAPTIFVTSITNGALVVTPLSDANGSGELKVRATDRGGLSAEMTVKVTITPVNDAPVASALQSIVADAAATPVTRELGGFFSDVDLSHEGDLLTFSIAGNTAPELFTSAVIDSATGQLSLVFAPYRSGEAALTIRATDRAGAFADTVQQVSVPPIPPPTIDFSSSMALNRQTGFYEQRITFTNSGPRAMGGFDITISGLPAGAKVNNASDTTGGVSTIEMRRPLEPGASVTIVIEYYVPGRNPNFAPQIGLVVTLPDPAPPAGGESFAIDRMLRQDDGSFLIEFTCEPGRRYEVQYSDDGVFWRASPATLTAGGNRLQWIDRGPPATDKFPGAMRFYRVREL